MLEESNNCQKLDLSKDIKRNHEFFLSQRESINKCNTVLSKVDHAKIT